MKFNSAFCISLFGIFFFGLNTRLIAQTNVSIDNHSEYVTQSCTVPASCNFYCGASTLNYTTTDSVDFFIDFGDGHDTTVRRGQYFASATLAYSNVNSAIPHTYLSQGNYPIKYIATLPDGNADTVISNMMITSTCNNVSGRLYIDVNNDCTYNAGDIAIPYSNVRLDYNNTTVSTAGTDAQGVFALSACPGYSYALLPDTSNLYSVTLPLTCSTFSGMSVTPSPTANQDLIVANVPTIRIDEARDSTNTASSNCFPLNSYIYFQGGTFGYPSPNDTVTLYMNFGDGTDTTFSRRSNSAGPANIGLFNLNVMHTYNAVGNFSVLYVATGPDGASDSVINYHEVIVSDTCGNVQGNVYIDNNNNCVLDGGDSTNTYIWVQLTQTSTGISHYTYTNASGHYSFSVMPGNYTVTIAPSLSGTPLAPSCPASATTSVVVTAATTVTADFAVTCTSSFDLAGAIGSVWPGIFSTYHTHIHPYIHNLSCTPIAGSIQFILDPRVHYVGVCDTAFHPTVNGDTLTWTFTNSASYINWYYWYSSQGCIDVNGDPSLQVGDTVCLTMIVNPIVGDINPANNTITRCVPAHVSLDPNTKSVSPTGSGPLGLVPQHTTFDYTIEFQNTGSAPARDVFILDTLDADLDLSTLQITGSSHFMKPQFLPGNVLKFTFENINLADSTSDELHSHGWVTYRIQAKPFLANGTPIQNTAGIYFDFNAPVITNTTLNTIYDPSSVNEIIAGEASVFPNPANSTIEINFKEETTGIISLTDLTGKLIYSTKLQGRTSKIDVSTLPEGSYLLILETENGRNVHKVIVQH